MILARQEAGGRVALPEAYARFEREQGGGRVEDLSLSDRRSLEIAMALCSSPSVLLLDEPAAGLARAEANRLAATLRAPRDPRRLSRLGIAFVPDDRGVFPRLTVEENIELARLVAFRSSAFDPFALFPDLARRRRQPAGALSGGQQQQLVLGRALATGPRLLIVDEDLAEALTTVTRESGLALILVEQNPELAMRICGRAIVMERGEIAAEGASATLDASVLDLLAV